MASNYQPKPGGSVKATLGDNVLCGIVEEPESKRWVYILPDGSDVSVSTTRDLWSYEPWVKPVEFKQWTVVRLAVDAPFAMWADEPGDDLEPFKKPLVAVRSAKDYWNSNADAEWFEFNDADIAKALAHGKAEVLFEGVEE